MKNNLSSNEKVETNEAACPDSKPCANGADTESRSGPTRRAFLGGTAATVAAGLVALPFLASKSVEAAQAGTQTSGGTVAGNRPAQQAGGALRGRARAEQVYRHRVRAAQLERNLPLAAHPTNADEELYQNKIGNYSKGLPHNKLGEVNLAAYATLTRALTSGADSDFENIQIASFNKLTNPQAGLGFEMQSPDPHSLSMKAAPAFSSAEIAAEIAENYWMALTRDVPFSEYETNPLTVQAAADLSRFSDFRGPKVGGKVTPSTLFRGSAPGTLSGPYISQFLRKNTLFGSEKLERRMRTVLPGIDYMTAYDDWLEMQNGNMPWPDQYDPVLRYTRNGRDLGQWVHYDVLFQAYFDALLVLFELGARHSVGNPYENSRTQTSFGTLGTPYVASIVCAVSKPALKSVWYQKWYVHRRLRPEEFAGRIHNHVTGAARYPIHSDILNSSVLDALFKKNGTYLLPQAYPEGAPTHPSYGAGHATVAGACSTVLKAFFDESFIIRGPEDTTPQGNALVPYSGAELTVGGELNKLAFNVAGGRNMAGVHWRSDATESLKLGEEVAIRFLREERDCLHEKFGGFSFTKFDGTHITV